MKTEFLSALKSYVALLAMDADFVKLSQLIIEYRFVYNKEEEHLG